MSAELTNVVDFLNTLYSNNLENIGEIEDYENYTDELNGAKLEAILPKFRENNEAITNLLKTGSDSFSNEKLIELALQAIDLQEASLKLEKLLGTIPPFCYK